MRASVSARSGFLPSDLGRTALVTGGAILVLAAVMVGCHEPVRGAAVPPPMATANESPSSVTPQKSTEVDPPATGSSPRSQRTIPSDPLKWKPLPEEETVLERVALGSCSLQYKEQPIWPVIESSRPQLFLHLGDLIYADVLPFGERKTVPPDLDVVAKARLDYAFLKAQAAFAGFAERVPWMSVWDDHDLGENDAGADFPRRTEMADLYLEFLGAEPSDPRRHQDGLYFAKTFGPPGRRLQILLVDTRSHRDELLKDTRPEAEKRAARVIGQYAPHVDSTKRLLGEDQWRWLGERLREPADVRLIGSSIQVIAGEKGTESWGNFPHERTRLYDLIRSTRASGVVLLSGDVHFAELSRTNEGPYPLYELTSSNLAQHVTAWGEHVVNPHRVSGPYSRVNFGQVSIDWQRREVLLSVHDESGNQVFSKEIALAELQIP